MIVEDDPMVAEIHRRCLQKDPRVNSITICPDGSSAWAHLSAGRFDLLLLDVHIPGLDGFSLLELIRRERLDTDVILVTAVNDRESLSRAQRLGALDYLLKPFEPERLAAAVDRFFMKQDLLQQGPAAFSQQDADLLFAPPPSPRRGKPAEKGIQPQTLALILAYFEARRGQSASCGQVAQAVGLSRVTVHKYLHYMEQNHQLTAQIDYKTEGRPRTSYVLQS